MDLLSVDVSPKLSKSLEAIFLRILLIILPDLVFGKPEVMCIKSGVAIGPIFSLIVFFKSSINHLMFLHPLLRKHNNINHYL